MIIQWIRLYLLVVIVSSSEGAQAEPLFFQIGFQFQDPNLEFHFEAFGLMQTQPFEGVPRVFNLK